MNRKIAAIALAMLLLASAAASQTTEFTYQGSLTVSGSPANGNYDFEFALFDSLSAGTQLGSTLTRSTVAVANGAFAVKLDFGSQFPGANRFLEIRVRQTGGGGYTPLAPRQQVNSSPYSVKSLTSDSSVNATNATNATNAVNATNATTAATATNALSLGGVAANQYVLTGDARLSDARTPTAGSADYIQNQNTAVQPSSNFRISGDGTVAGTLTAGVINFVTQMDVSGIRALAFPGTGNTFVAPLTGTANTTGATIRSSAFMLGAATPRATTTRSSEEVRAAGISQAEEISLAASKQASIIQPAARTPLSARLPVMPTRSVISIQ